MLAGFATLQIQRAAENVAQPAEPFTIVVLPDTQYYCDIRHKLSSKWGNGDLRRYFFEQTRWARDNKERLNISFLVHEGDMVQGDVPNAEDPDDGNPRGSLFSHGCLWISIGFGIETFAERFLVVPESNRLRSFRFFSEKHLNVAARFICYLVDCIFFRIFLSD